MRPIKTILYSSHFSRSLKKLPRSLQPEVTKAEQRFRHDCFDTGLRTHQLKGKHKNLWSFSITYKHRLVFQFLSNDVVYFIDIGNHSIYQ